MYIHLKHDITLNGSRNPLETTACQAWKELLRIIEMHVFMRSVIQWFQMLIISVHEDNKRRRKNYVNSLRSDHVSVTVKGVPKPTVILHFKSNLFSTVPVVDCAYVRQVILFSCEATVLVFC